MGKAFAFYGQLGASDLLRLLPEIALRGLMPDSALNELLPLVSGSDLIVRLYRNSLSHRKAHAGTISLEYDNCPAGMSVKQILCLLKALRDEINHVCSCVAAPDTVSQKPCVLLLILWCLPAGRATSRSP